MKGAVSGRTKYIYIKIGPKKVKNMLDFVFVIKYGQKYFPLRNKN